MWKAKWRFRCICTQVVQERLDADHSKTHIGLCHTHVYVSRENYACLCHLHVYFQHRFSLRLKNNCVSKKQMLVVPLERGVKLCSFLQIHNHLLADMHVSVFFFEAVYINTQSNCPVCLVWWGWCLQHLFLRPCTVVNWCWCVSVLCLTCRTRPSSTIC